MDLILAGFLGTFNIARSFTSWDFFKNNFSNFSNSLLTIMTIIVTVLVIVLPFYMKHHIKKNFLVLKEKNVKEEFGVFYSEYRIDKLYRALYGYYSLIRRLVLVLILVLLDDLAWLQGLLIMINSTVFMIFTVASKPYKSNYTQKLEVFNEGIIVFCSHINVNYFAQADGKMEEKLNDLKDAIGWLLIGLILFNIGFNILLVVISSIKDIFAFFKRLLVTLKKWKNEANAKNSSELLVGSEFLTD